MKYSSLFLISFLFISEAFAYGFNQNNKDYIVHCWGDDGSTWDVQQRAMVNNAHGLKLCADNKPSLSGSRFKDQIKQSQRDMYQNRSQTVQPNIRGQF